MATPWVKRSYDSIRRPARATYFVRNVNLPLRGAMVGMLHSTPGRCHRAEVSLPLRGEKQIRQQLIDGEFFYPEQAGIPKFRFHRYLDESSWYEFCELELVEGRCSKETFAELVERFGEHLVR